MSSPGQGRLEDKGLVALRLLQRANLLYLRMENPGTWENPILGGRNSGEDGCQEIGGFGTGQRD